MSSIGNRSVAPKSKIKLKSNNIYQAKTDLYKDVMFIRKHVNVPYDMMANDIKVPIIPNDEMVIKFWKNRFFFT